MKKLIWDGIEYEYELERAPVLGVAVEMRKRDGKTLVSEIRALTAMTDSWSFDGSCVSFKNHPTEWQRVDLLPAPAGAVRYSLRVYAPEALYNRAIPLGIGTPEVPLDPIAEDVIGAILMGELSLRDPAYRAEIQARAAKMKARV